uniref:Uncharacterized protein n=1 Tax=viral metagenome TaxID=1070528 RepID=A0A6C0KZ57_9ZZZZ
MAAAGRTPASFRLPDWTTFLEYLKFKIEQQHESIDEPVVDEECNGNTFLMEAVQRSDKEAVEYLVTAGADVNVLTAGSALTSYNPFMGVGSTEIIEILQYLLDNGAFFIQDVGGRYRGMMPDERAWAQIGQHMEDIEEDDEEQKALEEQTITDMEAIHDFLESAASGRIFDATVSVLGQRKPPFLFKYDKLADIRKLKEIIQILYLDDEDLQIKFDLLMPMAQIGKTKKEINANKVLNVDRTMSDYVGSRYNNTPVKLVVAPKIRSGFGGRRKTLKRK